MADLLPPREELPSPESQSGNSLAPPFGGAFFILRAAQHRPQIFFLLHATFFIAPPLCSRDFTSRFPSRLITRLVRVSFCALNYVAMADLIISQSVPIMCNMHYLVAAILIYEIDIAQGLCPTFPRANNLPRTCRGAFLFRKWKRVSAQQ